MRVSSEQRRRMLVSAGIEIARTDGGRAVTLARVAEAGGVSKPLAYRLFDSLADLLLQMERQIIAQYEAVMLEALARGTAAALPGRDLLALLAGSYVDHSLGVGAVFDTVSSARVATQPMAEHSLELPHQFILAMADTLALTHDAATAYVTMFTGAADSLVVAVEAGLVTREDAIGHLVALFAPRLPVDLDVGPR